MKLNTYLIFNVISFKYICTIMFIRLHTNWFVGKATCILFFANYVNKFYKYLISIFYSYLRYTPLLEEHPTPVTARLRRV